MSGLNGLSELWSSAVWRASWQGGVFTLFVWLICWLAPSIPARFQSWMWRLVALKFVVALVWSTPIGIPLLAPPDAVVVQAGTSVASEQTDVAAEFTSERTLSPMLMPLLVMFVGWLLVTACLSVRILVACLAARRLKSACRRSEDRRFLCQLAAIARSFGMTGHPPVLESDGDGSPLLVGILRPAIVVPSTTLRRLADPERAMVIGHELAHLRRADLAWGLLASVIRAVFFFHPLAWLCERRLRLSQEIAADELAVLKQRQDPIGYATLLVAVVGKFSRHQTQPALSLAAAGSGQSLGKRIVAMHFIKPVSRRAVATYAIALGLFSALGVVPWTVVAAEPQAEKKSSPDKPAAKETVDQKDKNGWGRFVSFKDGTLTVESNAGAHLVWTGITETVKAMVYDVQSNSYRQYEGTAAALNQAKPGTPVSVTSGKAMIRIGARKGQTVGTFVAFKDGRLLMLGKNLGESFTKKYGNNVHFNPFRADIPAYESVDGGEYKQVGTANKVLGNVKEGTILTIHGEGDDNITRVDIGVPKAN
ncbi:M56 family metallopeptidase [Humisphaera borealis]|uniref:M56 family metallopeptidase n=1 Tax=Humisphaera borealis TaxID=2807512 RepID=A0A7M2WVY2_9BACT|nr:M56 family metallopeptidase [Humisphaera borealis]QOV89707.1 M56 family metallopeptidase [Humisphaera borealis]